MGKRKDARNSEDVTAALVEQELPWLRKVVGSHKSLRTGVVQFDDLYSAALLGLWAAARNYDESRPATFRTYATPRVWGAIKDELRELDVLSRARRSEAYLLERHATRLVQVLGRRPTDDDLEEAGFTDRERELLRRAEYFRGTSLDDVVGYSDDGREQHRRELHPAPEPSDVDAGDVFALASRGLNWREQAILRLYYWERLSMREIAEQLEVSESRVSQWHAEILARLGQRSRDYWFGGGLDAAS